MNFTNPGREKELISSNVHLFFITMHIHRSTLSSNRHGIPEPSQIWGFPDPVKFGDSRTQSNLGIPEPSQIWGFPNRQIWGFPNPVKFGDSRTQSNLGIPEADKMPQNKNASKLIIRVTTV